MEGMRRWIGFLVALVVASCGGAPNAQPAAPASTSSVGSVAERLIVLHQRGSHGPDYSERYPPEFRTFTPDCDAVTLKSCSREEIVNAYDNTILYTDAVLDGYLPWYVRLGCAITASKNVSPSRSVRMIGPGSNGSANEVDGPNVPGPVPGCTQMV